MKLKCAFWVAGIGVVLASALRCIQMLCFFDYETGFVTDSGVLAWVSSGITLAAALVSGLLCRLDRGLCGKMRSAQNGAASVTSLLSALFLILCAVVLFRDAYTYRHFGVAYSIPTEHVGAHLPFAVLAVFFAVAALIAAVAWARGKGLPGRLGVVWVAGVVWALYYMVLTFMTYSASATTVENLFTVGGGAVLALFLLAEGKLIAGVDDRRAARDIYMFGLPTVVLWLTYVSSNTGLIIAGRGYATEMPYAVQLVMLVLCVHILALLATFHKANFEPAAPEKNAASRRNGAHSARNATKS